MFQLRLFFVMMMMIVADVFMRFVFNSPIRGVPLIITMSIIAIVFLQLADALRAGRLTRSDMLIGSLLANRPKLGYSMQGLFHLAGVFIMSVLLWYSVPFMLKAWRLNTYDGTDGEFTLPEWPVKAVIVVGAIVCAIQFCRHLLRDIETLRNLGNQP
ncbi:MAG: TRAP transporter small permease [Rhodospirillaceae bacterium]|nr:TRAP transporter small permease [Rhodospirillaceae bacterium]